MNPSEYTAARKRLLELSEERWLRLSRLQRSGVFPEDLRTNTTRTKIGEVKLVAVNMDVDLEAAELSRQKKRKETRKRLAYSLGNIWKTTQLR